MTVVKNIYPPPSQTLRLWLPLLDTVKSNASLHLIWTALLQYNGRWVSVYPVIFRSCDLISHSSIYRPFLQGPNGTWGHLFSLGWGGEVCRRVAVDSSFGVRLLHPLVVRSVIILPASEDGFDVLHLCVRHQKVVLFRLEVREGVGAFRWQWAEGPGDDCNNNEKIEAR